MALMPIGGLVAAGLVLMAMAIAAAEVAALLWLFVAAAHDRVVARGSSIGYWRWWGDRYQHLLVAWDQGRNGAILGETVRRRTIVRLEAQSDRLHRRLRHEKVETGVPSGWAASSTACAGLSHERRGDVAADGGPVRGGGRRLSASRRALR